MKPFISCLIVALPVVAWGADKSPDQDFFKHAAEGGIAEVEAGTLAQSKGNSQAVKDFGVMMVKDHTDANAKLASIAASESVSLPSSSGALQLASKAKLEVLTGDTFDAAYIQEPGGGTRADSFPLQEGNRLRHRLTGKSVCEGDAAHRAGAPEKNTGYRSPERRRDEIG